MMVVVRILKTIISDSRRLKAIFEKYGLKLQVRNVVYLYPPGPYSLTFGLCKYKMCLNEEGGHFCMLKESKGLSSRPPSRF